MQSYAFSGERLNRLVIFFIDLHINGVVPEPIYGKSVKNGVLLR